MKIIAIALSLAAVPAMAQNIPWFMQHNQERVAVIRECRDDYRNHATPERAAICANAEAAANRLDGVTARLSSMDRPEWWRQNPALRHATLTACRRRASYDQHLLRYCDAARQGDS